MQTNAHADPMAARNPVMPERWADPAWRQAHRDHLVELARKRFLNETPEERERRLANQREGYHKAAVRRGMSEGRRDLVNRLVEGQPQQLSDVARDLGHSNQATQQKLSALGLRAPERRVTWLLPAEAALLRMLSPEELLGRPEALEILRRMKVAAHQQTPTRGRQPRQEEAA